MAQYNAILSTYDEYYKHLTEMIKNAITWKGSAMG